ncbi:MAG: sodium transporter, partial [Bacteroidota bacterium]
VSATFNSASTLVTMDFVSQLRPDLSSKQLVRVGQIVTLVLVVLASLWAPQIERFGSLWEYLQIVLAFIAPPVAATFILGLFWKRANSTGAFVGLIAGFALAILMLVSNGAAEREGSSDLFLFLDSIHFLHMAFYLFVLSMIINVIVSLSTEMPDPEKVAEYTWKRRMYDEETEELKAIPWYLNYRYLAIILLFITGIIVGYFW